MIKKILLKSQICPVPPICLTLRISDLEIFQHIALLQVADKCIFVNLRGGIFKNSKNLTHSPHFATIVSDPPDCGDVLLGEGHPVLLTQGLVLLNGYCAVSTEVKLLKNIVKC